MLKKLFPVVTLAVVILNVLSCGYRFSPGGENINPAIQTVYIETFVNKTSEAGIENQFRNSMIDQFRNSPRFKLAEGRDQADAILRATIFNLSTSHLSYSATNVAKEDRVTANLNIAFENRSKESIWSNANFSWYEDYLLDQANTNNSDINRRAAIQKLGDDVASRAYRALMSGF